MTTYYDQYASQHAYARRNGYKGDYSEYVKGLYKAYKDICKRCDVVPMPFSQWRLSVPVGSSWAKKD
jgi:hypothetical protein